MDEVEVTEPLVGQYLFIPFIHSQDFGGFEPCSSLDSSDSFSDTATPRRVRFAHRREVRRMPLSEADDARKARMSYSMNSALAPCTCPTNTAYAVFYFAPLVRVPDNMQVSFISVDHLFLHLSGCSDVHICVVPQSHILLFLRIYSRLLHLLAVQLVPLHSIQGA